MSSAAPITVERHSHVFLGEGHASGERRSWAVIALCGAMMVAEIVGGLLFGSIALVADGMHMSTHAGALLLAALAYRYARRHAEDARFSFGTGKLGDLAGFTSAVILAMIALLIGYEAISRLLQPVVINFDVATGQVFSPSSGPTRTEADFVTHVQRTVESDATARQWHFVVDNLDIHRSESLVRYVAALANCSDDLGVKYVRGVLRSKASRAAFLSDPTHPVVFHYTPKHASWLNQVEIWLSILVRKLLRRGNFRSVEDLRNQVLSFIAYFNRTMAKPFKWTYQGKPLRV